MKAPAQCRCGCGETIPARNGAYKNKAHRAAHLHATGFFRQLGRVGGRASWQRGSKGWARHVEQVVQSLQDLVPDQPSFTRSEVLAIAVKARRRGYQVGYTRQSMRQLRAGMTEEHAWRSLGSTVG